MKKILILGVTGLVGKALSQKLKDNYEVFGTYNRNETRLDQVNLIKFEVKNPTQINSILDEITPNIIINCLRGDFENQLQIMNELIEFSQKTQAHIYFMSTANVFDACTDHIHYEIDERISNTDYGQFKIKAEDLLLDIIKDACVICRLPMVWGLNSPRLNDLKADLGNNKPIVVHTNLYLNTHTDELLANQINYIIDQNLTGIFHLGSQDEINHYDFMKEMTRQLGYADVHFIKNQLEGERYVFTLGTTNPLPKELLFSNKEIIYQLTNR